jgi:hypothetical protein
MLSEEERARLRDEENQAEFAIRREEASMAAAERELQRQLDSFDDDEERTKREIEAEWRREHSGRDPERPPAWRPPSRP